MSRRVVAIVGRRESGEFYITQQLEAKPGQGYAAFDLPEGTLLVEGHLDEAGLPALHEFLVSSGILGLRNATFHMVDTDYGKTIRIIQDKYFALLEESFTADVIEQLATLSGPDLQQYILEGLAAPRVVLPYRREPVTFIEYRVHSALVAIRGFWEQYAESLAEALRHSEAYKVVLPLQEAGMYGFEVSRRMALYFDTLLIPDPLHFQSEEAVTELVVRPSKDAEIAIAGLLEQFSIILKLRLLRSGNGDCPIVAIVPDFADFDEPALKRDSATFLVEALGVSEWQLTSSDFKEPITRAQLQRISDAVASSSKWRQLLQQFLAMPSGWRMDFGHCSRGHLAAAASETELNPLEAVLSLHSFLIAKMYSFRSTTIAAAVFKADPLTQMYLPEAYRWFFRSHGADARYHPDAMSEEGAISHSLVQDDMAYWESVSLDALRTARESGQLEDLRRDLRLERHRVRGYGPDELHLAAAAFTTKTRELIAQHAEARRSLIARQQTDARRAVASLVGSAALAGVSIAFPAVSLIGLAGAAISLILGSKSIRDIVLTRREAATELGAIDQYPIAMLYDASVRRQIAE